MSNYKAMYFLLFNAITDAIEVLKKAQEQGEKVFIEENETLISTSKMENV